jgi:hypothetical protein
MNAFNRGGRFTNIYGTKGELRISLAGGVVDVPCIKFFDFATREWSEIEEGSGSNELTGGHGGGDAGIMSVFSLLVSNEYNGISAATIETSCKNHMIVFAAEESRKSGKIVDVAEFSAHYGI